jgi:hypothetical protein
MRNANVAPRMASNQVALGVQRGIVSRIQSSQAEEDPIQGRPLTGLYDTFSSPAQRAVTATMSSHYSQQEAQDAAVPAVPAVSDVNTIQNTTYPPAPRAIAFPARC